MISENEKIIKLLNAKSAETNKFLDKINKSLDNLSDNYLDCFKYPEQLIRKLNQIDELVNLSNKTPEQIVAEIKQILC